MNCLNVYTSSSKNRPKIAQKIGRSPKCLLNCLPGLWSQVPSLSPSRRRRHRFHSRRLAHEAMHQHRVINGPLEKMCVRRAACLSRSTSRSPLGTRCKYAPLSPFAINIKAGPDADDTRTDLWSAHEVGNSTLFVSSGRGPGSFEMGDLPAKPSDLDYPRRVVLIF